MGLPQSPSPPVSLAGDIGRVTQRDIARHLGVSHVSVSLALRRNERISPALTMRVHEAAKHMGYLPDPMLGALNHYRVSRKHRPILASLAWISPWLPPNDPLDYTEFALYWQGARGTAERHGYRLDKFSPDSRGSFSGLQRVLDARGLNGLLIAPPQSGFHLPIEHIDWARHSSLRFGHALSHIPTHVVTSAQCANAALATDAILDRGYRRIGFVTTRKATRRTHFLAGFLQAQALRLGPGPVPPLLLPEIDPSSDLRTLSTWLRLHRPDAILTNLRPLRHMLAQLDRDVPRDIALATLSVHDGDADAGIDQNPRVIGETACETLIAMVQQNTRGFPDHPREIFIRGRWVDGSSLPRRQSSPRPPCPPAREPRANGVAPVIVN